MPGDWPRKPGGPEGENVKMPSSSGEPCIVVYDGDCGICSRLVRFTIRHDRRRRLLFCSNSSPAGRTLIANAGHDPDQLDSVVLLRGEQVWIESAAAIRIAALLGPLGLPALALLLIPRPLRDGAYRWIARHRHRLPVPAACAPIPPEWKDRFLG